MIPPDLTPLVRLAKIAIVTVPICVVLVVYELVRGLLWLAHWGLDEIASGNIA